MPPDRDTPGARAALRHLVGDAEIRREVAKDALREGAGYADPDPSYVGHVPSSMSQAEVEESWMRLLAREGFEMQDVPEEEVYEADDEVYDDGFDLDEQGGTLIFDEGVLSAEADERGLLAEADEHDCGYFAGD